MSTEIIGAPSLTEPGAGSDFAAITAHARRVPGGWEVIGEKAWVAAGAFADLLVMYAMTTLGSCLILDPEQAFTAATDFASAVIAIDRP